MAGPLTAFEWFPFTGLDPVIQILFTVTFVIVVAMFCWTGILFLRGVGSSRKLARGDLVDPDVFEWIFLVPALNEEVTIADSVGRLEQIEVAHKRIVVINDGSDDGTGRILAGLDSPDLTVLTRTVPNARQGKAAALNHAFHAVISAFRPAPESTIFCVVDADGRIAGDSPAFIARHFARPQVGGVQSLVRIYNRHHFLTWFQDLEFSIYGRLFQAGRNRWGTAGMGGNGQYNRMSALMSIAGEADAGSAPAPGGAGPWRDRLTEDQDLGLRLLIAGWRCEHDNQAVVEQQGVSGLRALFRQRTRWSQGNLQAMSLIGAVARSRLFLPARIEQVIFLLMPVWQMIIGAALITSICLWLFTDTGFLGTGGWWWLYFLYLLGFGGTVLGSIAARTGDRYLLPGLIKGVLSGQVYAFYTWLLWPVLLRSSLRQLVGRGGWAKTARERI